MSEPQDTARASSEFTMMLSRLRAVEHFAVGRRVLATIAVGWLSQLPVRQVLLGYAMSRDRNPGSLTQIRHMMGVAAGQIESDAPALAGVFTEVLVPDIFQSQFLEQGAMYAASILELLPNSLERPAFGSWFSERLDQIVAAGPAGSEVGTPQGLADFMIALAEVRPGHSVYDPACGLGGLLARAAAMRPSRLHGSDVHPVSWAFTSLRLFLLGAVAQVDRLDALRALEDERFDRVVCDPPLGGYLPIPVDPRSDRARPSPPSRRLDALFLEKSMNALKERGRGVVLVAQSTLFRRGHEQDLRVRMLEQRWLQAVIGLPPGSVAWTSAELALVVLDRSEPHEQVLFLDGAQARQGGNVRGAVDYGQLLAAYAKRQPLPWSRMVDLAELREDQNLVPRRRLFTPEERPSVSELIARYETLMERSNARMERINTLFERLRPADDRGS